MKIVIVTQDAPLYLAAFLDDFLYQIGKTPHEVSSIVIFPPYFKNSIWQEVRDRYCYYGDIDFLKMFCLIIKHKILSFIFNFCPFLKCHSVDNIIKKYGIKRYKTKSVNSKDFIEYIKMNCVDLIISIASPKIFNKDILSASGKGCINYHTSFLPKYRGRQPLFWALLNGDKEVGISIHWMDEALDNGPIITQSKVFVDLRDSLHSLYLKTVNIGPRLLMAAVNKVSDGSAERIKNDAGAATYYSFPTKEDSKVFKAKGRRFF
jgi:folate-dependent phosphoribosylglycinamide formyltransferase PurN